MQQVTLTLTLDCSHEDGKTFAHMLGDIAVATLQALQIADSVEVRGQVSTVGDTSLPVPPGISPELN